MKDSDSYLSPVYPISAILRPTHALLFASVGFLSINPGCSHFGGIDCKRVVFTPAVLLQAGCRTARVHGNDEAFSRSHLIITGHLDLR